MKTILASLAFVTLVVSTASAATHKFTSDQVIVNGQVVGQDPDANIRGYLMRNPYAAD
jgi:hypothetical protein